MRKNFLLLIIAGLLLLVVKALTVSADATGCAQLFENNCAECHDLDRGCKLLGQAPEKWADLFKFMKGMGADIDQQERLINCLSKPDDGVKATCGK